VGTEIASVCMEQNLTYEEYIARRNADALGHIPTLCSGGRFLPTQKSVVALNGTCYFSAEALATHLDWSASEMIAGESLLLYSGDGQRLTLLPGMRYYRDERVFPLSSPALELDGTLYLTLEDLSQVLGFRVQETDAGLELISPQ